MVLRLGRDVLLEEVSRSGVCNKAENLREKVGEVYDTLTFMDVEVLLGKNGLIKGVINQEEKDW